jgi:hypothetical protein
MEKYVIVLLSCEKYYYDKRLLNKQIFSLYSYFLIDPCIWSILWFLGEYGLHTDLKHFRLQCVLNMILYQYSL